MSATTVESCSSDDEIGYLCKRCRKEYQTELRAKECTKRCRRQKPQQQSARSTRRGQPSTQTYTSYLDSINQGGPADTWDQGVVQTNTYYPTPGDYATNFDYQNQTMPTDISPRNIDHAEVPEERASGVVDSPYNPTNFIDGDEHDASVYHHQASETVATHVIHPWEAVPLNSGQVTPIPPCTSPIYVPCTPDTGNVFMNEGSQPLIAVNITRPNTRNSRSTRNSDRESNVGDSAYEGSPPMSPPPNSPESVHASKDTITNEGIRVVSRTYPHIEQMAMNKPLNTVEKEIRKLTKPYIIQTHKKWTCGFQGCQHNTTYSTKQKAQDHVMSDHLDYQLDCTQCGAKNIGKRRFYNARKHTCLRNKEKTDIYKCPCPAIGQKACKKFVNLYDLKKHLCDRNYHYVDQITQYKNENAHLPGFKKSLDNTLNDYIKKDHEDKTTVSQSKFASWHKLKASLDHDLHHLGIDMRNKKRKLLVSSPIIRTRAKKKCPLA